MDRFAQIAKEGVSVQERGLIIPEPEKKDAIFSKMLWMTGISLRL